MTTEEAVRLLADKDAIRELTARYAHAIARGDGLAVVALFTDDAVFETKMPQAVKELPGVLRGAAQLSAFYAGVRAGEALPCGHDHVIVVAGDVAHATCSVEIRLTLGRRSVIASGYYDDRFRREPAGWKFSSRVCTFFHVVPLRRGWAKAAGSDPS